MTSFAKNKTDKPLDVAIPQPASTEVAVQEPKATFQIGKVTGPVRRSDYKIPGLNIVHNTGLLQENFTPGSLVLNKEIVLSAGNNAEPIKLTVLAFDKYFMEKLPFKEDGPMPRIWRTEEELAAAGMHTNWVGNTPPPAFEAATALVAIESDKDGPHFPFSFGDKFYALAEWKLQSQTAFSRAGKKIITAGDWNLKDGLHNGSWTLTTSKEKLGGNWVWCPVLKGGPRNSKELAEFFTTLN